MKYYFHLCNDADVALGAEGRGFASEDEMRGAVLDPARDFLGGDLRGGTIFHSLDFRDAVLVTGLER